MKFLFYFLASTASVLVAGNETTPLLKKLVSEFEKESIKNIDEAIPFLKKFMGPRFVASSHSQASQGSKRVLLSRSTGELIIGIGATDEALEVVEDDKGQIVNYEITFLKTSDGTKIDVKRKPKACAGCHSEDFVYIWGNYNQWPHYHGSDDDFQDPNNAEWMALKKIPRFTKLFDNETSDPAYPYYSGTEKSPRKITKMSNTVLSLSLGRRAARALSERLKVRQPERYQRYKNYLMRLLLECPSDSKEKNRFETEFRDLDPKIFAKWNQVFDQVMKPHPVDKTLGPYGPKDRLGEQQILRLLHFLGVPPNGIILTERRSQSSPLDLNSLYDKLFVTHESHFLAPKYDPRQNNYSPIMYPLGDSTTVGIHLAYFLSNELNLPALTKTRKPVTSLTDEYFLGEEGKVLDKLSPGAEWTKEDKKAVCEELRKESYASLKIEEVELPRHEQPKKGH